jgi:hypothetical protein
VDARAALDLMMSLSDEETDHPHYADRRNFYKVESGAATG